MKVSIKPYNQQYLHLIASQMGIDKPSEVINYLLLELKKMGYSFGSPLPQIPQYPMPNAQQPQQHFDPGATVMSALSFIPQSPQAIQEFEQLTEEIDPVIARMATLIENF
jgi:hypothetical protein